MSQLTLPFAESPSRPPTIPERFELFHEQNPDVYRRLRDEALRLRRLGHKRWGVKNLFEVLRWQHGMETTDAEFKLNNDYTKCYSRLLMAQEPELDGFFETREQKNGASR